MAQRPVSITIFGILNIGLAVFGAASLIVSNIVLTFVKLPSSPITDSLLNNPTYRAWTPVSMFMGLISNTVMLVAGIALLLLKNWGRILSIAYAIYAILWSLIGCCMTFILYGKTFRTQLDRFGEIGVIFAL